ncbi:MAG: TetR-like C-terminal domain-containing protein [Coriobacteriales bacterium]|jgi:AcrR family transcriptional regulator
MSNLTEKAIIQTFTDLLSKKPLEKITVTDITSVCGINRNTFYYHYHDIYDLLDKILLAEEEKIKKLAKQDLSTWKMAVLEATKFAREHKEAVYNIYNSRSRDKFANYLKDSLYITMSQFTEMQAEGLDVDQGTKHNIAVFCTSAIQGLTLNWLQDGMDDDPEDFIDEMGYLLGGTTRLALERADKQNKNKKMGGNR